MDQTMLNQINPIPNLAIYILALPNSGMFIFLEAVASLGLIVSLSQVVRQSVSQGHFNKIRKWALQNEV